MNRLPRLSICLPVYNGERYLRAAVESLLCQTFSDFELVIADNASTDATEAICRDFAARDERVRYHRNPRNLGAAPNFNRVIHLSRAPMLRWAAADDLWHPRAMERCVEALDADESIVCCHVGTRVIDADGKAIPVYQAGLGATRPTPGAVPFERLYDPPDRRLDAAHPADRLRDLLLRTHWCYEIFGIFRRPVLAGSPLHGSYYGSDKVLLAHVAMRGRMVTLGGEPMYYRRDHEGNSTSLRTHTERAEWMDTSLAGKLARPHFKLLRGYAAAIVSADVPVSHKAACWRVLAGWMLQLGKFKHLVRESDQEPGHPELTAGVTADSVKS